MKILIVEDNEAIAQGLKVSLEAENYQVDISNTMQSAREKISQNCYHLMIFDILLPDGNGIDLCKELKQNYDIPILFLTAKDKEQDIINGLNVGADDYIVKPFRIGELLARIHNALRKYKKTASLLKIEDITIDLEHNRIEKGKQEVTLTSLEWRIFLMLLNARGNIVTRDRLLNLVYDISGNFINDNSLTVYIKRLREKLEDDINHPKIIKTIKGIGYKIENE